MAKKNKSISRTKLVGKINTKIHQQIKDPQQSFSMKSHIQQKCFDYKVALSRIQNMFMTNKKFPKKSVYHNPVAILF